MKQINLKKNKSQAHVIGWRERERERERARARLYYIYVCIYIYVSKCMQKADLNGRESETQRARTLVTKYIYSI